METYDSLLASITPGSGETRTIFDPATGGAVGEAPVHTVEDLEAAVAAAVAAQPAWAALGHDGRSAALLKAADAVERSAEELAQLLSREQGKPLNGPNARFEVGACAAWLRATATTELTPEVVVDDGETYAELHY
ncbi:aldehyde dehydrogenase, partial [Arthrobacter globiformis NBRC 12137]